MTSVERLVESLCFAIVHSEGIRVRGKSTGYRNKITYTLSSSTAELRTSPLASERVNAVALAVDRFRAQSQSFAASSTFWNEVNVKETRKGEVMIKIVFLEPSLSFGTGPSFFDDWLRSPEPAQMIAALSAEFGAASIRCVVAHVVASPSDAIVRDDDEEAVAATSCNNAPCGAVKPGKLDRYVPLTKDQCDHVLEYTPNGLPFVLSPDSFCEVNHEMEDAIFQASVEFLQLQGTGGGEVAPNQRSCFMTGRDVNCVFRTFCEFYQGGVTAVSTCPRVLADASRNQIPCHRAAKEDVWRYLEGSCAFRHEASAAQPERRHHVLITAGRHGLHPLTVKEMVRIARTVGGIDDVLYVSCNVESMVRDMFLFKEAFVVANCRTFDFFPQTNYVMSVVHLRALPQCPELTKRLLILPVGPPGAGKSTTGAALISALCTSVEMTTIKKAKVQHQDAIKRRAKGIASITRVLDVLLPSPVDGAMFQRDEVFASLRCKGFSLAKTRTSVHEAMVDACKGKRPKMADDATVGTDVAAARRPYQVTYLDSTNGFAEARAMFASTFLGAEPVSSSTRNAVGLSTVLELFFTIQGDYDSQLSAEHPGVTPAMNSAHSAELLRRCQGRTNHPAFPETVEEQRLKIATILDALHTEPVVAEMPHVDADDRAATGHAPVHRYSVATTCGADSLAWTTHTMVSVLVGLHLFCDAAVASNLVASVPWSMLFRRWGLLTHTVEAAPSRWTSIVHGCVAQQTQSIASHKRARSD